MRRRQGGYGRGARQKIETDGVEILGGVIKKVTTGAPLGFLCMVNAERDKPSLPTTEDRKVLEANPEIAAFLKGD